MFTHNTLFLWLEQQAGSLALLSLLLALGVGFIYLAAGSRHRRLLRERAGLDENTFVEHLAAYDFDRRITRAAYRRLQQEHHIAFPILPTDLLEDDLGLEDSDIHATVRALLAETNRRRGVLQAPVNTVEDLVRYLQASPRKMEAAA